ncbi:hypothetical protein OSTOST_09801, partial [Ostertagia ostertagi]
TILEFNGPTALRSFTSPTKRTAVKPFNSPGLQDLEIYGYHRLGSCWAVSSAAAMSDRICIASKGAKQVLISAQDAVSCCTWCGDGYVFS